MRHRFVRAAAGIAACLLGASTTRAQLPGAGGGPGAPRTSPIQSRYVPVASRAANPYLAPGMNPYLNPYLSTQNVGPDAALLYFMAAQQQTGGIGSGVISGVRQAEMGSAGSVPAPAARTAGPFGNETRDRYFHRGQGKFAGEATGYFQRTVPRVRR